MKIDAINIGMSLKTNGEIYKAKVIKIIDSGAIVRIGENNAFLHISEISQSFVRRVEDVLSEGQEIYVVILEKRDGKIFVSMKNVPRNEVLSFEEKLQLYLKESNDNWRQIEKNKNRKIGVQKRRKRKKK